MIVVALVPVLVVGVAAVTSLDLIRGRSDTAILESREELTDDVIGGQLASGARQVISNRAMAAAH